MITKINDSLRTRLIDEAKNVISDKDPSHDIYHALRVLANAEMLWAAEGGDIEIIIPAALFHDVIVYPKDSPKSGMSAQESARLAEMLLKKIESYDKQKIPAVVQAITEHSFCKKIRPKRMESKIVQDADRLEATGAIAIMRTFCSTGQMQQKFYEPNDPFCEHRRPERITYALDFFYERLLNVSEQMNTPTARAMAEKRTYFLYSFLSQLRNEITV